MPIKLNGETYFWTAEACQAAGTSKNTFLRWVKEGRFPDIERWDRRGWRLFTEDDLNMLKAEVNKVQIRNTPKRLRRVASLSVPIDKREYSW